MITHDDIVYMAMNFLQLFPSSSGVCFPCFLSLDWPCDLLWPKGNVRCDFVWFPSLYLKRPLSFHSHCLRAPCTLKQAEVSLFVDERTHGETERKRERDQVIEIQPSQILWGPRMWGQKQPPHSQLDQLSDSKCKRKPSRHPVEQGELSRLSPAHRTIRK